MKSRFTAQDRKRSDPERIEHMKAFKRIVSLALAAAAGLELFASGGAQVSAYANDTLYNAAGYTRKEKELAEKIKQTIKDYSSKPMDVSSYDLSFAEFEEIYVTMIFNEPSLYYVSPISAYVNCDKNDKVLNFAPVYNFTKSRKAAADEKLKEYTDQLLSGIHEEWSDAEKVLYVHDYIAAHARYYEGSNISTGRNIYDLFMNESSVCVGYAMGFQYIMDILGIPCISITNDDHIWNMVEINSNWYHVDITWDDSMDASPNFVFHRMLLLSEYGIDNTDPPHDPWDYGMTADSSKYDNFFWNESCSSMAYLDGYWYYSTADGLCRYSFDKNSIGTVYRFSESWTEKGKGKWLYSFSQVQEYNGEIYFNTPTKILKYSPKEGKLYRICQPKLPSGFQIYDLSLEGGVITVYSGDTYEDMDSREDYYSLTGKTITAKQAEQAKQSAKKTQPSKSGAIWNPSKTADTAKSDKTAQTAGNSLTVRDNGDTITVSWQEDPNAEQYVLYRYNKETKKIAQIATVVDNQVTFVKTEKDSGCLYSVKVRTDKGLGEYAPWTAAK